MTALEPLVTPVPRHDPGSTLPLEWSRGPFMQVFVRAYQDSNGDGIGDLPGLISRLDYLRTLGIRALWLMPIMPSADHDHGYATVDYRAVDPDYGSLADLDALLAQAHRRGMGVILDYVVNHCASEHPLFVEASRDLASPFRDWFLWTEPKPSGWDIHGHDPWIETDKGCYFSSFSAAMPDFNLRRSDVVAFHVSNLNFWLARGVDGFRFDAAAHFIKNGPYDWKDQPEGRRLVRYLGDHVRSFEKRYVVCESTAKPWIYSSPSVGGSAFAFGLNKLILRASAGTAEAVRELADFFVNAPATMATLISNHDRIAGQRLWDEVGGDRVRYRLVAATYLLLPGIPFVYYGEEVGMSGVPGLAADDALRAPMSWAPATGPDGFSTGSPFRAAAANAAWQNVQAEAERTDSLLQTYRILLGLRNRHAALSRGSYEDSFFGSQHFGFVRRHGDERLLVLINYGREAVHIDFDRLPVDTRFEDLLPWGPSTDAGVVGGAHGPEISLPAQSVALYRLLTP